MAVAQTEEQHPKAGGLDLLGPEAVLSILADAQAEAARAVTSAIPQIAKAAELAASALKAGGRIGYAAAGSSGLMAMADALELPGTYGIGRERIAIMLAGGQAALYDLAGSPEDDTAQAVRDFAEAGLVRGDCLIALSASGSTPYAIAALEEARRAGLSTVAIANNADTPILKHADAPIVLATPPEVIAGSTRMGAGTAQKIALNMLSTLMAVHLGHVHDGYMVNVLADNIKLKRRASSIVAAVSGCSAEAAARFLEQSGGAVKPAILLAAGSRDAAAANDLLQRTGYRLRPALTELEGSLGSQKRT
ncbi:N-acetylmuramic acid 6-phosphate etherase [Mesorhizobium sp. NBSH29]|uniref:N-acetylmuramic acid 6-phosphate etherase n=1 Tax=Mesorhizobium sp. NBSH29 TaxID=2654249 RepID=UPI00189694A4|nr:N-acetylmuramic acid 6-phosphate etherase [Mesorhizobium sp. NBSH29]QPC86149.1 N-acetylmuramic acid 6-phosphate etherase [Mesorhizobium sp. NBSH29]